DRRQPLAPRAGACGRGGVTRGKSERPAMTAPPIPIPDPAQLTASLIRCPSVTPDEGGALVLLADVLGAAGFECHRVDREGVPNLFARWGARGARTFGFNGHTDVVPPGDPA